MNLLITYLLVRYDQYLVLHPLVIIDYGKRIKATVIIPPVINGMYILIHRIPHHELYGNIRKVKCHRISQRFLFYQPFFVFITICPLLFSDKIFNGRMNQYIMCGCLPALFRIRIIELESQRMV